jgi:hypothetical protein
VGVTDAVGDAVPELVAVVEEELVSDGVWVLLQWGARAKRRADVDASAVREA